MDATEERPKEGRPVLPPASLEFGAGSKLAEEAVTEPHGLRGSFAFAFSGLWFLIRTQRNARIEIVLGLLACLLGSWLRISATQWAIVFLTIALVLILEGLNTSIEAAIDLFSTRR